VNQAAAGQACSYGLNPTTFAAPVAGGPTTVAVTTTSGCSWTTTGVPAWITVLNNSGTGNGNGTVSLQIAANTGAARSATLTIAGQSYTVNQAAPCSYSLNPTSYSPAALGGSTTIAVTTAAGCSWSTTGLPGWITFTNGNGTGSGNGNVSITVQTNTGAARTANLTIAGQQFTVSQAAVIVPCTYLVSPGAFDLDKNAHTGTGAISISVQTTSLCTWTAAVQSGSSWLTIRSGAAGIGNGTTLVDVDANNGPARTGTLLIAGQLVTINQEKK
jgi:hypothetical protein